MRPVTVTVTSVGSSSPVGMDYLETPFNGGIAVAIKGSPTYTVQYTAEQPVTSNTTWFPDPVLSGAITSGYVARNIPTRYCQLQVTSVVSATDAATMTVLQGGNSG